MEIFTFLLIPFYFVLQVLPEAMFFIGFISLIVGFRSMSGLLKKLGVLFLVFIFLRCDAIIGELKISYICGQSSEYFRSVNQIVELDKSFWDGSGWPSFHSRVDESFIPEIFDDRYEYSRKLIQLDSIFISKINRLSFLDLHTGESLYDHNVYYSTRGWFSTLVGSELLYGRRCGNDSRYETNNIPGSTFTHYVTGWVFLPKEPLE